MFSVFCKKTLGLGTAVMLAGVAGLALPANAAFIATMDEVGPDVVITGSGSFDTSGLTPITPASANSVGYVEPSKNAFFLGGGGTQNDFSGLERYLRLGSVYLRCCAPGEHCIRPDSSQSETIGVL